MLTLFLFWLALDPATSRAHDAVGGDMATAAQRFLDALNPEQRTKATFAWKDEERLNWHFIPRERKGLSFKEMTPAQRLLAHALVASGLSYRGYMKAVDIMSLEQILLEMEQGRGPKRDPELYFVSLFGKPGAEAAWAWRLEGHHMSLNFTLAGGHLAAVTPSFLGSNPGEVRSGSRQGLRVLAAEEDLARQLVASLSADQRKIAIYDAAAPKDIITGADRKARSLEPLGLAMDKMSEDQAKLLRALVSEYVNRYRAEVAHTHLQKIHDAGAAKVFFAWAGSIEPKQGHYYRIQTPTFLFEYDNTQNDANHIHCVWRDLENDFGDDVLRRHYEQSPHHQDR